MWRSRLIFAKLYSLFHHESAEQEFAREVAAHLALIEEDLERRGMPPEEARLAPGAHWA
ncbi:MAG TPA: permease prefix domain 1-containing protein [Bryobacteraceae bacterium]|nr:permease prefix domain 1-containing protein [Bryobacteraceae bacterium]